jgi:hypothetical protein
MVDIATAATGEEKSDAPKRVTVHVKHLGEHEKANFKVEISDTLQGIWNQAYIKLAIEKLDRDVFQAPRKNENPIDLGPYLALTLDAAQNQGLCDDDFEIAARTGGA